MLYRKFRELWAYGFETCERTDRQADRPTFRHVYIHCTYRQTDRHAVSAWGEITSYMYMVGEINTYTTPTGLLYSIG